MSECIQNDVAFQSERDAYLLLREQSITQLGIFDVPELRDFDDDLRIVEIGIVSPPYLLDFGKAYVSRKPPYTVTQISENLELCRELFEPSDWSHVEEAITELSMIGIAYLDIKPSNIRVG